MKPLLVIGDNGQLARALKPLCPDAVFLGRSIIDLAFPDKVAETLECYDAHAIINTAAYTQVDKAESEEQLATTINAESPAAMASYCAAKRIPLVHFSTDYVFDGSGDTPWKENDTPAPLNAYGRSKQAGEQAIAQSGCAYLIFRTSWLYDATGTNFLNTMLRLAGEREELKIINDQFGAPTYVPQLAEAIVTALAKAQGMSRFPSGIYHVCHAGVTSWHEVATAIIAHAKAQGMAVKTKTIAPIPASEYPLPAKRPANSRLNCNRALSMFGVALPAWQDGLDACMEMKREQGALTK